MRWPEWACKARSGSSAGKPGTVVEIQDLFQNGPSRANKSVPQFGLTLRGVNEVFSTAWGDLKGDNYEIGVVLYY